MSAATVLVVGASGATGKCRHNEEISTVWYGVGPSVSYDDTTSGGGGEVGDAGERGGGGGGVGVRDTRQSMRVAGREGWGKINHSLQFLPFTPPIPPFWGETWF